MSRKTEIQSQITELQAELAILNSAPEDVYTFGTIAVFASGPQGSVKTYYRKIGEELWLNIKNGNEKDLASWIYHFEESEIGYFEVYIMTVAPSPVYASS